MGRNNADFEGVTYGHKIFSDGSVMIHATHKGQQVANIFFGPEIPNAPVPGRYVKNDTFDPFFVKGYNTPQIKKGLWDYGNSVGLNLQKENLEAGMFHVSPKQNRERIQKWGIQPSTVYPGNTSGFFVEKPGKVYPRGVFVSNPPRALYGDDIWKVDLPSGTTSAKLDRSTGDRYLTDSVLPSMVSRVGHFFRNAKGHPEIHWHHEEDCDGKSIYD